MHTAGCFPVGAGRCVCALVTVLVISNDRSLSEGDPPACVDFCRSRRDSLFDVSVAGDGAGAQAVGAGGPPGAR